MKLLSKKFGTKILGFKKKKNVIPVLTSQLVTL